MQKTSFLIIGRPRICMLYFSGVEYFSRAEVREIAPPAYSFIFIEKENVVYAYDRKFFISGY